MTAPLTCRELVEFLDRYLAGELTPDQCDAFDLHLSQCPACVAYMKSYADATRLGRAALLASDAAPRGVPEELVAAILASRRTGA